MDFQEALGSRIAEVVKEGSRVRGTAAALNLGEDARLRIADLVKGAVVSERAREADREFSEDVAGRITSMLGLTEDGTVGPTGDGSALSNHARARIADMVQEAGRGERSRSQLLSN